MSLSPQLFAKILDYLEFPEIIAIIKKYKHGNYVILPHITTAVTVYPTVNPYNITMCQSVTRFSAENCRNITNNILLMLPKLQSLVINGCTPITGDVFEFLINLESLEIIGKQEIITSENIGFLDNLKYLHFHSNLLTDNCLSKLSSLRVLVIDGQTLVTPKILNMLPHLELCVLDGCLIKFCSSIKNIQIVKKIKLLREIKIYAI